MTREEVLAQVLGENDEEYSVFDDSESDEAKKTTTMRASQGGGGGGACSQDPLTFLDFIPCSPLLKPLGVPLIPTI